MDTPIIDSKFGFSYTAPHRPAELAAFEGLCEAFERSPLPLARRLQHFPRHIRRQDMARFLARTELFKLALDVNGSIVEGGVFCGGGVMTWAHLSAIYEPYNHTRRIFGLDTFSGFPDAHAKDTVTASGMHPSPGQLSTHADIKSEIEALVALHDSNRPVGHIPKVHLVAGDARESIPKLLVDQPHLLISLMYLDFDLYEPTRCALRHLLPRVVAGGVVAFDELNCQQFPGETQALLEEVDLSKTKLRRFPIDPYVSYFIKE